MLFIPSHDPPHRPVDPRASAFHRFALVALAIDGLAGYRASDVELRRDGRVVHRRHAARAARGRLARRRSFSSSSAPTRLQKLPRWREFPGVLDAAHFAVIARPGTTLDDGAGAHAGAASRACAARRDARGTTATTAIFLVEARTRDVSSTTIRARLAARQPIDDLVPAAVARHIVAHHLYGAVDDLHGEDATQQTQRRDAVKSGTPSTAARAREGRDAEAAEGRRRRRAGGARQEGGRHRRARPAEGGRLHRLLRDLHRRRTRGRSTRSPTRSRTR